MANTRFEAYLDLSPEEASYLSDLGGEPYTVKAGAVIRKQDGPSDGIFMLQEGAVLSIIELEDGAQQIVKVHAPGDIIGATSLPFEAAVDTAYALLDCSVSRISQDRFGTIFARFPRLGAVLFLLANEERAHLMDAIVVRGKRSSVSIIASLLITLFERVGFDKDNKAIITFPLTQQQIADAVGLSNVHTNRVLRDLEARGYIRRTGRNYELLELDALRKAAGLPLRRRVRNASWLPAEG